MIAVAALWETTAGSAAVNEFVQTWSDEACSPEMGHLQDLTQPCSQGPGTHFAPWVTQQDEEPWNTEWERSPFWHRCRSPDSEGSRTLPNFFTALPGVAGSFFHRKVAAFAPSLAQARRLCQAFGLLQAAIHLGATPQIAPRIHHYAPALSGVWARTLFLAPTGPSVRPTFPRPRSGSKTSDPVQGLLTTPTTVRWPLRPGPRGAPRRAGEPRGARLRVPSSPPLGHRGLPRVYAGAPPPQHRHHQRLRAVDLHPHLPREPELHRHCRSAPR